MTEAELMKKPKWDWASRILGCEIEDGACDGHAVAFVRLVESDSQPDDEKELLWLCQRHFSALLKQEEKPEPEPEDGNGKDQRQGVIPGAVVVSTRAVEGVMESLPIEWAPLEPGLNVMATSLEPELLCGQWRLVSRGDGTQWAARTHTVYPPFEGATPVRRRDGWYWRKGGEVTR